MERLERLALIAEKEEHIDIFPILYFAKHTAKLLYFAYFYDPNKEEYSKYYNNVRDALAKFVKKEDVAKIFDRLADVRLILDTDLLAMIEGDPVAPSKQEVVLCYPGFQAIIYYRIAHMLYDLGYKLIARIISEYAHRKTQVDIHPGAIIGKSFCIDHGTGVVIGETAVIHDYVRIYQGVTLGAKWLNDASLMKGKRRHPTIMSHVIIYANATILGGDTIIKENSIIGANAFITSSN